MVTVFSPLPALAGGLLIGTAAVLLMAAIGRVAGVSGIAAGLLRDRAPWRWSFLVGLAAGAAVFVLWRGLPTPRAGFAPPLLVASGLLVGFGTALAGGCTSGHGVCGLARLSARSLAATLVFLACAVATTFVVRHVIA